MNINNSLGQNPESYNTHRAEKKDGAQESSLAFSRNIETRRPVRRLQSQKYRQSEQPKEFIGFVFPAHISPRQKRSNNGAFNRVRVSRKVSLPYRPINQSSKNIGVAHQIRLRGAITHNLVQGRAVTATMPAPQTFLSTSRSQHGNLLPYSTNERRLVTATSPAIEQMAVHHSRQGAVVGIERQDSLSSSLNHSLQTSIHHKRADATVGLEDEDIEQPRSRPRQEIIIRHRESRV